jgi:phage terminase small subunit
VRHRTKARVLTGGATYTVQDCLDAIVEDAIERGRPATRAEWRREKNLPTVSTIEARFGGSFTRAVSEAGLDPVTERQLQRDREAETPKTREELKAEWLAKYDPGYLGPEL